jgi:DNA polymerase III epsilon subunit-like protein
MKVLLFDTETNGLPKNRFAPPSQTDAYPAVLQISWAMYALTADSMTLVDRVDKSLRLAPEIPWDTGAAAIHGIPEAKARVGEYPAKAFLEFREVLHQVDYVICHNMEFDKPVVRAAAYAASSSVGEADAKLLRSLWSTKIREFCTMNSTRALVGIPSAPEAKHPFKAPRLNELYTKLYGHVYDLSGSGNSLHSARSDTHCLAQCVIRLLRRGHLRIDENNCLIVT